MANKEPTNTPPKRGPGRPPGSPNKATKEAREAFRLVYERRIEDLDAWLTSAAEESPAKAADLLLRMAEHFVPKLSRVERGISDATDEELLAEIRRRESEGH